MQFYEALKSHYTVRSYSPRPVERDKLLRVIEAALYAPTYMNQKDFRLILTRTRFMQEELTQICSDPWFVEAPYVLGVISTHAQTKKFAKDFSHTDCASVLSQIMTSATNEGLGTCWVANFNTWQARAVLRLPEDAIPIAFTPLGYPGTEHRTEMIIVPQLDDYLMYEYWTGEEDRENSKSWLADPKSSGRRLVYRQPSPKKEES
ncbi:nitroreductase family protein [Planctomycetota bacterium]